jgi:hypothetical protein
LTISIACVWCPIMPCMKSTSAGVKAWRAAAGLAPGDFGADPS